MIFRLPHSASGEKQLVEQQISPACENSVMGEISSKCQRRKAARAPGTSRADSSALHQDTTLAIFFLNKLRKMRITGESIPPSVHDSREKLPVP
jgi:hypothetical protein